MSDSTQRYLSFVLSGALVITGLALAKVHKASAVRATTTQSSESPLVFKTVKAVNKECLPLCLAVEASLTNGSSDAVAIDTVGLRYQVEIQKLISSPTGGSEQVMTKRGDYGPGQYNDSAYRVLRPGETYTTTVNFPLTDKFFRAKGSYKITFTYGQFRDYEFQGVKLFKGTVESNTLDFNAPISAPQKKQRRHP